MKTKEIPRSQWKTFSDALVAGRPGARVTIEVFGREIGDQIEATNRPLLGFTAETRDRGDTITMMVGTAGSEVSHRIQDAKHLRVRYDDEGVEDTIEIEAADGITTLVRFAAPALMLDAVT